MIPKTHVSRSMVGAGQYAVHHRPPPPTRDRAPTLRTTSGAPGLPANDMWPEDEVTDIDAPVDVLDRPPLARTQTRPYDHKPTNPTITVQGT